MNYAVPDIPFLKLRLTMAADQDAFLPDHKGSMLRGAFGYALRATVCTMKPQQDCKDCLLRGQCAYTQIFETFINGQPPPFLKGLKTAPRPFIIETSDERTQFVKGQELIFDLILLGTAWQFYPYVIFAFHRAAEKGLSTRSHPFWLQQVQWFDAESTSSGQHDGWKMLYNGHTQTLIDTPHPATIEWDASLISPLRLSFLTPTRLKFNGQYGMDFTFRKLAFKMLRRTLEIAHFYVPEAQPDWDFHDYLVAADAVRIASRNLHWQDWHRHSNRQKTDMQMGGFVGEIVLDGDLKPFTELLRVSEVIHVGKGTTFGLGKIKAEVNNSISKQ